MDRQRLEQLLIEVQNGALPVAEALEALRSLPYDDLGFARLDTHRALRQGTAEVVFCQNKTIPQAVAIFERLWAHHARLLGTRVPPEMAAALEQRFPQAHYDPLSRLVALARQALPAAAEASGYAAVVTGGTADLPVAEEAAQTLEFYGCRVQRVYDVGVAGLHRLLDQRATLFGARVILSVAGMEGALTSVVGGLARCPVIGVPTSVGYGASFNGLAALLAMLNSCAPGVGVVNIDNGFGAAMLAQRILQPGALQTTGYQEAVQEQDVGAMQG